MKIVLLGKPGCGKGTLSNLLKKDLNCVVLSTGDMLRNIKNEDTELGRLVKDTIDGGNLIPDDIMFDILNKEVFKHVNSETILFDGYPRNTDQAQELDNLLDIDFVVYLDVSDDIIKSRILERGKVSGREDDRNLDIINHRLKVFNEETLPLKTYYQLQDKLKVIDGSKSIDEVHKYVFDLINTY